MRGDVDVLMWVHCPPLGPVGLGASRPQVRVGRVGADITLPHKEVSRRHAVLRVERGVVLVEDLGSSNGTYLNHVLLRAPASLVSGDKVGVGPYELRISSRPPQEGTSEMETTAIISSLAGDLTVTPMAELFQDLEFHQRSGVLEVRNRRVHGRLEIEGGVPCAATCGDLEGYEALRALLGMRVGHFVFSGRNPTERPRMSLRLVRVMMDHARDEDEGGR
jgi:pSer/pThr/pTyr-binding forkhead associated (FHA) protein